MTKVTYILFISRFYVLTVAYLKRRREIEDLSIQMIAHLTLLVDSIENIS